MRFKLENEFEQFFFKDTSLYAWENKADNIQMLLSGVIAKGNNPCNEEFVDRYVDTLQLRLIKAKIKEILLEGYRYYDANDVLVDEVPDQIIPVMDYQKIVKECVDNQGFLFQMEKDDKAEENTYQFSIDVEKKTYLITIAFDKAIFEWERFLNRVQM